MKKLVILVITSLFLSAGTYAAGTHTTTTSVASTGPIASTGPAVPASVNAEFSHDFSRAKDVKWEVYDDFYKATFDLHGKVLYAFYNDNDLIGMATNIPSDKLPYDLQAGIKKSYANYWITGLFKYRNETEDGYTITLENADQTVILKSAGMQEWNVYQIHQK